MDCDTTKTEQSTRTSLFGILKFKTKYHSKFLNRFWAQHQQTASSNPTYARLSMSRRTSAATIEHQNYRNMILPKDAIQLQCLDVGSLLKMNERRDYKRLQCESLTDGTLSFAGSSLDLEWEHEYDATEKHQSQNEVRNSWYNSEEDSSSSSNDGNDRSIELSQFSSPTNRLNWQNNNYQSINTNTTRWHSRQWQKNPNRSISTTKLDGNQKMNKPKNGSSSDSLEWDLHEDDHKFKSEDDSLDQETVELLNEIEWLKNQALIETGDRLN